MMKYQDSGCGKSVKAQSVSVQVARANLLWWEMFNLPICSFLSPSPPFSFNSQVKNE